MDNAVEPKYNKCGHPYQDGSASDASGLLCILGYISKLLEELGGKFLSDQKRTRELMQRLTEERFHLAILGQFKRGKSTLLNAFLGEALLPTSVVPVTSIPTFLRAGPKRLIRVFFLDGKSAEFPDLSLERAAQILADYVTEERNPTNKLGVASVEVEHPSSLLSQGVVMIDTPGIGSTFRHNTEATLNFLPQCDAALFMVSADPPITEVEVEFLRAVRGKVARLFFVLNKVDYLTEEERNTAVSFFRKVVHEQVGFDTEDPVFSISSRQGLQANLGENKTLWQQSGLSDLQGYLLDFLARDKSQTLESALASKAIDVAADATMRIRLQRRSLQMPLDELEERIQIFDEKVREAEQERITTIDLLAGDRKRAVEFLEKQAEDLRQKARSYLERVAHDAIEKAGAPRVLEQTAKDCLAEEIPIFFEEELRLLSQGTDRRVREILRSYQDRADALVETIRSTAAELFNIPYHILDRACALERTHEPYWVAHNWTTSMNPIPEGFMDRFFPAGVRERRIRKRLFDDIKTLVVRNVENIRWAMLQNLDQTFRRFASAFDERMKETVEATGGAMRAACLRRAQRAESVEPELQRLNQAEAEMAIMERPLVKFADMVGRNG